MKHRLFTAAIVIAALVLYGIGMLSGAFLLFAAGAACELCFWARIRRLRALRASFAFGLVFVGGRVSDKPSKQTHP